MVSNLGSFRSSMHLALQVLFIFLTGFSQSSAAVQAQADVVISPHPSGYDSAAEFLLRHLILKISYEDLETVHLGRASEGLTQDRSVLQLYQAYRDFAMTKRKSQVSAFNVFVRYSSQEKTEIESIFIDQAAPLFKPLSVKWTSPLDMVREIGSQVSEVLHSGQYRIKKSVFEDVQENTENVLRVNEAGRILRIAGVDQAFENFLLAEVGQALEKLDLDLSDAFYFGSRVMTRVKVLDLNPDLSGSFGLAKGRILKSTVRERGLTSISDLELYLVAKSRWPLERLSKEEIENLQESVKFRIRKGLNQKTRRFPFGLKVLIRSDQSAKPSFEEIRDLLRKEKNWPAPPEQYVRFFSRDANFRPHPRCLHVFRGRHSLDRRHTD